MGRLCICVDVVKDSYNFTLNKFMNTVYILLTVWSRVFLEKLIVAQLLNAFPVLHQCKVAVFTLPAKRQGVACNI
jgi:hypothetical protein